VPNVTGSSAAFTPPTRTDFNHHPAGMAPATNRTSPTRL
jgi:hypothetical protein